MVMGPGGYSTKTFVRFGIPVTLVALTASILMGWALLK
jgi:di/tricarboxylate transporter